MRTKTLLTAAAALAVGLITSQTQAQVYSQNIVGYVNTSVQSGFTLLENPLDVGTTNGANEVIPALPDNTTIYVWNGGGYDQYLYVSGVYYDPNNGYAVVGAPTIPPGKGIFIDNPGVATNITFVGTVAVSQGATNTMTLGSGFSMIGSVLPEAGSVSTDLGLNLPDNSVVYTWNGSSFDQSLLVSGTWYDPNNGYAVVPEPSVSTAEAFFVYIPTGSGTWTQTLPSSNP